MAICPNLRNLPDYGFQKRVQREVMDQGDCKIGIYKCDLPADIVGSACSYLFCACFVVAMQQVSL